MFTTFATWYPLVGREAEMRALAVEFVKTRQARGERYRVAARLYSPVGPALTLVRSFQDLAELEAASAANDADAEFQAALARARALSRAPNTGRLREVVVPINAMDEARYVQSTLGYPATGNGSAIRALLSEFVTGQQQAGRSVGFAVELYEPEGPVFVVTAAYPSLAALEERTRANRTDAAFQTAAAEVVKLCRRPPVSTLHAVVA